MILIQNVYYMLSYAFKVLKEQGYKDIATEEFENAAELLSEILVRGLKIEIKRGLFKNYVNQSDTIATVKGKIDINETLKQQSLIKGKIVCNFDEFTVNTYLNQIIKSTLLLLLHSDITKDRKKSIKNVLVYFNEVDTIDYNNINWNIIYSKNNQNYKMLISICNLIIKGLIQTTSKGQIKLMDFLDEQRMSALYEKFILEYYRKEHPEVNANASFINWQLDDGFDSFLPQMKSDITLEYNSKILIIDAKYYSDNMQHQFNKDTIISGNMYQIFTYVKNKKLEDPAKEVAGMLLYAKTETEIQPDSRYKMSGNNISVKSLDLNKKFNLIAKQLDDILTQYL